MATIGRAVTGDGWTLRTFDWPGDGRRGSILWLGGRGDIFEKYLEAFGAWQRHGWHISSFDWRGQGGSGRLLPNRTIGHIDDFQRWIDDLAQYWSNWTQTTPAPHVVMGHSMGGHLALRAIAEQRIAPHAVVLSAPMLDFDNPGVPRWLAETGVAVLARVVPTRRAWSENERPSATQPRQTYLTHDAGRYADELWWKERDPSLATGPPSWAWLAAAVRSNAGLARPGMLEAVKSPVLIVGTHGDRLVSPVAIEGAAHRLPNGELMMCSVDAAHKVLREVDVVRDPLMARIDDFLACRAPVPA